MFASVVRLGKSIWLWANNNCPWTNVYGFARTLLALGTASTLIFNQTHILFRPGAGIPQFPVCKDVGVISIFCLGSGHLEIVRWIAVGILLVIASGWRPRYTAIFHWWISFSLNASALTLDGGDQITAVLTLLILPIALTDDRRWHWQSVSCKENLSLRECLLRVVALTGHIAIRLQVAIVYFHAAVGKLGVEDWVNGTVLYYWLTDPRVGLANWSKAIVPLFRTQFVAVITWSAICLEIFLFMALVMPKVAWKYLLRAGIAFHVSIALTMGLISFSTAMIAALVLYLRPFEEEFAFSFAKNVFARKEMAERMEPAGVDVVDA
jgi:antimicrobial peptide system SdpB family protein